MFINILLRISFNSSRCFILPSFSAQHMQPVSSSALMLQLLIPSTASMLSGRTTSVALEVLTPQNGNTTLEQPQTASKKLTQQTATIASSQAKARFSLHPKTAMVNGHPAASKPPNRSRLTLAGSSSYSHVSNSVLQE